MTFFVFHRSPPPPPYVPFGEGIVASHLPAILQSLCVCVEGCEGARCRSSLVVRLFSRLFLSKQIDVSFLLFSFLLALLYKKILSFSGVGKKKTEKWFPQKNALHFDFFFRFCLLLLYAALLITTTAALTFFLFYFLSFLCLWLCQWSSF